MNWSFSVLLSLLFYMFIKCIVKSEKKKKVELQKAKYQRKEWIIKWSLSEGVDNVINNIPAVIY